VVRALGSAHAGRDTATGATRRELGKHVIVWIGLLTAVVLAGFALRLMAYAFSSSVGHTVELPRSDIARWAVSEGHERPLRARQWVMLLVEIAFSIGMTLMILGLSFTAAMPPNLMIGALLAQVAVLGALVAPPLTIRLGTFDLRPAAAALGIAQIAHVVFFLRAAQALWG